MTTRLALDLAGCGRVEATAVIFDLDGVLAQSRDAWPRAERRAIELLGLRWCEGIGAATIGVDPQSANERLANRYGLAGRVADVAQAVEVAALEIFPNLVAPMPGAAAAVRHIASYLPVAVATNSPARVARVTLAAAGLDGFFDIVVTADDVAAGKPAPDPYLRAVALLGAARAGAVAIEDSVVGIAAAHAAGLAVIAFGDSVSQALPGVVGMVGSWDEVSVHVPD